MPAQTIIKTAATPDPLSKPMKIAYVTGVYPAMSLTFVEREIQSLRGLGFDIRTVSMRQPSAREGLGTDADFGKEEVAARDSTYYLLKELRDLKNVAGILKLAFSRPSKLWRTARLAFRTAQPGMKGMVLQCIYVVEALALARFVETHKIDRIHNHFAGSSTTVSMLTSLLTEVPFSFTLHGPSDLMEPVAQQLGAKVAYAEFVSCISYFARSQCSLYSETRHWDKMKVIHCGVQPDRYKSAEHATGQTRLLFVGRLAHVKGLPILFDALALLKDRIPNLTLQVVGDGKERADLEKRAAEIGVDVVFLGFQTQDQVAIEMSNADIFVLPSLAEGVPVVLMEAMASGKPVIATRVAGVSELVEDKIHGLLVRPGDAQDLATAVETLCMAPELCRRMGQAGRAKVRSEFDIDDEAARLARLFHGDLSGSPRPEPIVTPDPYL